ncbi:Peptidyl-prolyl cis-trans isomerase, FKBP-type domain-containing protein [Rozella allomycis CSF55]|uniref:peptidylprolyl isomerase n=1 Tax=Rozella allomycis (strain CSF55) TaxID=988480 RepID=A0A075AQS1_ROZAC|nr:Peptidyl-prolyl cis-trans isomerase, FKBP-type domain-containing protein [Rozella allomycis CSF55]|eukprot:EPZ31050.1 Peptidyl-prolyl cis-trans isomerase, FKBP-type domain-containing protein [Rozella allomycis CSF55]
MTTTEFNANEFVGYETLTEDKGLFKKVIREGAGPLVEPNTEVYVHYVGTLLDGQKFDSRWDQGVSTMRVGEISELICTPEYAYGASGSPPKIPPNSTLKFEVELIDYEKIADTTSGSPPKIPPNSTLKFEVELIDYEKIADTNADKIKFATDRKLLGNEKFKAQKYVSALNFYEKGLKYVESTWGVEDENEKKQFESLKLSILLNIAACCLKVKDFIKVKTVCKKALEIDSKNVKATFRLALNEFDESFKTLEKARELDPEDKGIFVEIENAKKLKAALELKQKNLYARMKQFESLKLSILLNIAACCLKVKDFIKVKTACKKALEIDSKNVKAMFRLALAALNEFDESFETLEKARELDLEDKGICVEIENAKKLKAAFELKQKNLYARMVKGI